MASHPRPHTGDVIIGGQTIGDFAVCDSEGTLQVACATIEELLDRIARYSERQQSRVWCACDDLTLTPVIDPVLLRRMWSEFVEMPGLRLTAPQARRLWGVGADTSSSALETLVALKVLVRAMDGTYGRPSPMRSTLRHAS
jgi:Fic family protein